jgi:hypothetical protein
MARTRAQRQVYADLLDRYGRAVADAFFEALDRIKEAVSIQRITAELEAGNIEGALDELDINPADFNDLLDHIRDAQKQGGKAATDEMPKRGSDGTALRVRYDGRADNAETWMRQHSSQLITRTTSDMRAAARALLTDSLARGRNPKSAALDLVGRVNRVTGKRDGGVLGLSVPQEEAVRRAREELASPDAAGLRNYLTRPRRDRRFDRSVTKAIREGRAVEPTIAANAIRGYAFPVVAAMLAVLASLGMRGKGGGGSAPGKVDASVTSAQGFAAQQEQAKVSFAGSVAQQVEVRVTADRDGLQAYVVQTAEGVARPMVVQGMAAAAGATRAQVMSDLDRSRTYSRGGD